MVEIITKPSLHNGGYATCLIYLVGVSVPSAVRVSYPGATLQARYSAACAVHHQNQRERVGAGVSMGRGKESLFSGFEVVGRPARL